MVKFPEELQGMKSSLFEDAHKAYIKDCEENFLKYRAEDLKRQAAIARIMNQVVGAEIE